MSASFILELGFSVFSLVDSFNVVKRPLLLWSWGSPFSAALTKSIREADSGSCGPPVRRGDQSRISPYTYTFTPVDLSQIFLLSPGFTIMRVYPELYVFSVRGYRLQGSGAFLLSHSSCFNVIQPMSQECYISRHYQVFFNILISCDSVLCRYRGEKKLAASVKTLRAPAPAVLEYI